MINLNNLEVIKFPDGHVHLRADPSDGYGRSIEASIRSFDDLFLLAQAKMIMPQLEILGINYLLAARCDKKFSENEALDLKIVSKFINSLGFKEVQIVKPHSEVSLALIDNSEARLYTNFLLGRCKHENNLKDSEFSLISPDSGASKWIAEETNIYDPIQCDKVRDLSTGKFKSIRVPKADYKEKCIIVDDLCDGGRTFLSIAEIIRRDYGVKNVFLVVTHGIFSQGFRVFDGIIDKIYCTSSFAKYSEEKLLSQYNLF